jgi:AbrB family looped-hinge helix DNA binding protein
LSTITGNRAPSHNAWQKGQKEINVSNDAKLTSKGQITIPKEIRDSLSMKAGDRMTFTLMPDATVVMRVKSKSVTELAGVLRKKGRKRVPIEQLSRWC